MKKFLIILAFGVAIGAVAVSVWSLSGMYVWKGRPWVRIQATAVYVESTLCVKDTIITDFIVPDDSGTVHLAGWADSSSWADSGLYADTSAWADSSLYADTSGWADSTLFADSTLWADSTLYADTSGYVAYCFDTVGVESWGSGKTVDTLVISGVGSQSVTLITPWDLGCEHIAALPGRDTVFVKRKTGVAVGNDNYSFAVKK